MVRLLRPHQYTKNLLIFAAPGAAGRLDEAAVLLESLAAFALFCAVSSAGYVANDLIDAEADRQHPRKKHRPIASGAVSPDRARILLVVLLLVGFVPAPFISWPFATLLVGYAALTLAYSNALKLVPWVELVAVSAGFLLRAAAGGAATETFLSSWFLTVVSAGALFVITGKRLGELLSLGQTTATRVVLRSYEAAQLRAVSVMAAAIAIGAYIAWALTDASNQTGDDAGDLFLKLTTAPFIAAITRYLVLSWRGDAEAPDIVVLRDVPMLALGAGWIGLYLVGLYT
ncbi:MAG: decaprenyl-phosphate phosphoribosyltransferase [Actinomycetota bacterium]